MTPFALAVKAAARVVATALVDLRVSGASRVPRQGGVVIAANHASGLDPVVIGAAMPRPAVFVARRSLFRPWLVGWFLTAVGAVPVERDAADPTAVRRLVRMVESGAALVLFPEGTRSEDGSLGRIQPGAGRIASMADVPVVPCWVSGTHRALPRGGGFRQARVSVAFGPQIRKAGEMDFDVTLRAALVALRDGATGAV